MAPVALMTDTDALSQYQQAVNNMVKAFSENSLELNITKTKDLCCGGRNKAETTPSLFQPLSIQGQLVEQVWGLGTTRKHNSASTC